MGNVVSWCSSIIKVRRSSSSLGSSFKLHSHLVHALGARLGAGGAQGRGRTTSCGGGLCVRVTLLFPFVITSMDAQPPASARKRVSFSTPIATETTGSPPVVHSAGSSRRYHSSSRCPFVLARPTGASARAVRLRAIAHLTRATGARRRPRSGPGVWRRSRFAAFPRVPPSLAFAVYTLGIRIHYSGLGFNWFNILCRSVIPRNGTDDHRWYPEPRIRGRLI